MVVQRDSDVEIMVVDFKRRALVGRGFVSGELIELKVKAVEDQEIFSVLVGGEVLEFEVVRIKADEPGVRLLQRRQWPLPGGNGRMLHCWSKEELVVKR